MCKGDFSNQEEALHATTDDAEGAAVTKKRAKNKSAKAAVEQTQLPMEEDEVAGKKKEKEE
jgi:hypothetical protein